MQYQGKDLSDELMPEKITAEMDVRDVKRLFPETLRMLKHYQIASFGCG